MQEHSQTPLCLRVGNVHLARDELRRSWYTEELLERPRYSVALGGTDKVLDEAASRGDI